MPTHFWQFLAILTLGGALWLCPALATEPPVFTAPDQFLVDQEPADLVALVKVVRAETRWVILHDGDHLPLIVADCVMEKLLSGAPARPAGETRSVTQLDYSELLARPITPPVMAGRTYLLFAARSPEEGEIPVLAPWTAQPGGFFLVRHRQEDFIYWNGQSHRLSAIQQGLTQRLPLDQIADPVRRLRAAEVRLRRGEQADLNAFIRGLLVNIRDPEGQARAAAADGFGAGFGEANPHSLWYQSLALLRDLGRDETRREPVVAALAPLAQEARPAIRLAAALALVDLGSDAGRAALIAGFESESGAISQDPPSPITFPGRYPFDESSVTACAHALARLGDERGLKHRRAEARLAAAEALQAQTSPELKPMLEALVAELDPQVERLRTSGELTKPRRPGDFVNRYPANWVRTQGLLARQGGDAALRRLIEAYLEDATTYPREEDPLLPRGRPVTWSSGPSLGQAIRGADLAPAKVLERLRALYGDDPRWDQLALQRLRASLEGSGSPPAQAPARKQASAAEIVARLEDPDPERRAEALAAAGYHRLPAFFDRVLSTALSGTGIERDAAVYALGFYDQAVPEAVLRQLLVTAEGELRTSALELATRTDPARFAAESLALARDQVTRAAPDDWMAEHTLEILPRFLARLARGPIPQLLLDGLKDPDPQVRRVLVKALELSGNPDAVRHLEPLAADADAATREAIKTALHALGPPGD